MTILTASASSVPSFPPPLPGKRPPSRSDASRQAQEAANIWVPLRLAGDSTAASRQLPGAPNLGVSEIYQQLKKYDQSQEGLLHEHVARLMNDVVPASGLFAADAEEAAAGAGKSQTGEKDFLAQSLEQLFQDFDLKRLPGEHWSGPKPEPSESLFLAPPAQAHASKQPLQARSAPSKPPSSLDYRA